LSYAGKRYLSHSYKKAGRGNYKDTGRNAPRQNQLLQQSEDILRRRVLRAQNNPVATSTWKLLQASTRHSSTVVASPRLIWLVTVFPVHKSACFSPAIQLAQSDGRDMEVTIVAGIVTAMAIARTRCRVHTRPTFAVTREPCRQRSWSSHESRW